MIYYIYIYIILYCDWYIDCSEHSIRTVHSCAILSSYARSADTAQGLKTQLKIRPPTEKISCAATSEVWGHWHRDV